MDIGIAICTGICLKACYTAHNGRECWTHVQVDISRDVQKIAPDEHIINIPLPHLIYMDVNLRRRKRGAPSEPKNHFIKFIDGLEHRDKLHVMLAVDQNEHIWVAIVEEGSSCVI